MVPERHSRTCGLIGEDALARLRECRVAVFGMGGVGCYAAEALSRVGLRAMTLVDGDKYAPSNLNRQLFCTMRELGRPKAVAAAERIAAIDPSIALFPICLRASAEDIPGILHGGADYVVDAIDDVDAKVALAVYCRDASLPLVSCMGAGNRIGTQPFRIGDIYSTHGDPLAKVMRRRLREVGIERLDVCWSPEEPYVSGARTPMSISYVPAMAGLTLAGHVIRALAGLNGERKEV